MELETLKTKNNYTYTVTKHITPQCHEAKMMIEGTLGSFESGDTMLLITARKNERLPVLSEIAMPIETVRGDSLNVDIYQFNPNIVYTMLHIGDVCPDRQHQDVKTKRGRLTYPDGRVYEGELCNGVRHGHGKLLLPSGEYFEGVFENGHITENGTYYDANGKPRDLKAEAYVSPAKRFFIRTKNLWMSVAYFVLAALSVYLIILFVFDSNSRYYRRSWFLFIAPFLLLGLGAEQLLKFVDSFDKD